MRAASTILAVAVGALLVALVAVVPDEVEVPRGLVVVAVLFEVVCGAWALHAFLHHRHGQQDELLAVLSAAAEAGLPLAPAVAAYRADRAPRRSATALRWLSFVALPPYAYARVWVGWRPFDRLLADLSARLDAGEPLAAALRDTPGVAAREVRLAAAVGETTGALGQSLRAAGRERWSAAWLEVAPRLLYPLLVLVFVSGLTAFLMAFILPKFKRIFDEFGMSLPQITISLGGAWDSLERVESLLGLAVGVPVVLLAVVFSPTLRWHTPGLGALYRWGVQADVLRTLGRLFAVGHTAPAALAFLAASDDLPAVARRAARRAAARVERGDALDTALADAGLLPPHAAPLVRSAESMRNLPWALVELGDHLAGRAVRLVRRLSLVLSPVLVALVGAVVGFIALAMFLPLVKLITGLTE